MSYIQKRVGNDKSYFNPARMALLDELHGKLKKGFSNVTDADSIAYIIDRAALENLCTPEEAKALREEFLSDDLPPAFVLV